MIVKGNLPNTRRLFAKYASDTKAIRAAADELRSNVNPPVATGELRASIRVVSSQAGGYRVEATAPHARYVEFGTSRMSPQPFLRDAYRKNRDSILKEYITVLLRHKRT